MGHAGFTPDQRGWQWFDDDGAEPTGSKANENTTYTLTSSTEVCRLRVAIGETGGAGASDVAIDLEYSTDDSSFNAFGAAAHWNYYDGQATEGNILTGTKISDSDTSGEYSESAGGSGAFDIVESTVTEFDICIQQTANASGNTLYYFRVKINAAEVSPGGGETHPNLTTYDSGEPIGDGISTGKIKKAKVKKTKIKDAKIFQ
jgi:hypothetical protein